MQAAIAQVTGPLSSTCEFAFACNRVCVSVFSGCDKCTSGQWSACNATSNGGCRGLLLHFSVPHLMLLMLMLFAACSTSPCSAGQYTTICSTYADKSYHACPANQY